MLQTVALCSVSEFRKEGKTHDRNGKQNVFLQPLSGQIPNKCMVLSGTVAINNGIEIGKSYVFKFTETNPDSEHGRQFNTQKIAEASVMDILQSSKMGKAEVIVVTKATKESVVETEDPFANTESEFDAQASK